MCQLGSISLMPYLFVWTRLNPSCALPNRDSWTGLSMPYHKHISSRASRFSLWNVNQPGVSPLLGLPWRVFHWVTSVLQLHGLLPVPLLASTELRWPPLLSSFCLQLSAGSSSRYYILSLASSMNSRWPSCHSESWQEDSVEEDCCVPGPLIRLLAPPRSHMWLCWYYEVLPPISLILDTLGFTYSCRFCIKAILAIILIKHYFYYLTGFSNFHLAINIFSSPAAPVPAYLVILIISIKHLVYCENTSLSCVSNKFVCLILNFQHNIRGFETVFPGVQFTRCCCRSFPHSSPILALATQACSHKENDEWRKRTKHEDKLKFKHYQAWKVQMARLYMTRGLFQKAGFTNSEPNPELWVDELWDGRLKVFGSRTADLSESEHTQSWLNWVKRMHDDYKKAFNGALTLQLTMAPGHPTSPHWS